MKYWLWKLLGKRYWLKLKTHCRNGYTEWEQRKNEIRNSHHYQLQSKK